MTESGLVSVVIPSYNRKNKILDSVRSVQEQSYEKLEIIVVDDGSKDGTWELFKNFPDGRLRYLRYEENQVPAMPETMGQNGPEESLLLSRTVTMSGIRTNWKNRYVNLKIREPI